MKHKDTFRNEYMEGIRIVLKLLKAVEQTNELYITKLITSYV